LTFVKHAFRVAAYHRLHVSSSGFARRTARKRVNDVTMNGIVPDRSLLLVHEPRVCETLAPTLVRRGFHVLTAHSARQALDLAPALAPRFAVVALKLPDATGLRLIAALRDLDRRMRIVILTSYPSIETAVEAIKLGAVHYLGWPVKPDRLVSAMLEDRANAEVPLRERRMSVHRVTWEYIHHVLQENGGNISATARALAIDRRTLQRKLRKRPVAE
jgi:two-component system response regulator RegA